MPLLGPNVTRPGKLESQPHCKGGSKIMLYMTSSVILCLWIQYTTLLNCCLTIHDIGLLAVCHDACYEHNHLIKIEIL